MNKQLAKLALFMAGVQFTLWCFGFPFIFGILYDKYGSVDFPASLSMLFTPIMILAFTYFASKEIDKE